MRYILLSALGHFFILFLLFWFQEDHLHLFETQKPQIVVEIISAPATAVVSHATAPKTISQKKKKRRKRLKKVLGEVPIGETQKSETAQAEERTSSSGEGVQQMQLSYAQQLKIFIEQNKHYPRMALRLKQTGIVKIRLEITTEGEFKNIKIAQSSPHPNLNKAALELLKRLKKFKPLPQELKSKNNFIIPIAYKMSGGSSLN